MASSVISTVTKVITTTGAATPTTSSRATPQGGILEGGDPSHYDPKNPIIMFIIQAGIIIIFCRLLHYPLSRLRQPRVIAEVIGGIILGPSVMGHIPGFTQAIFPQASMPSLTLVANLGLVLFLFLVGLEVDLRFLASNWRIALSVGAGGMALPFGLGCAIAYGLFHEFHGEAGTKPIDFGVYMLFIGVAMAITAFPVLCRILTELKLLGTPVGIIVLSAGVGNDVVGWILLALCVALVNAGDGLTALWVLLTCLGYTLFLVFAVRPGFMRILRRTGSLQNGPTQSVVCLTLLIALTSAFFTGIIGVHPIFGAFMVGLICPHEGGFAIKVTEKVEDLVSVLFLPLYFALSGLSTNIGLLNNGITWAYVIGVICVAFFAKITGGTLAARLNGLVWRESFTIGALMSCKGLVELIVLNIGLQAKILSTRTFTIFVVMALVTTFITTPLTSALYPHWYQVKLESWKRGEIDWDGNRLTPDGDASDSDTLFMDKTPNTDIRKLLTYLRLDSLPGVFTFVSLLAKNDPSTAKPAVHHSKDGEGSTGDATPLTSEPSNRPLEVHGVRLLELTERDSSVMKVSEEDEYAAWDPVVNTFRTFGQLNNVAVSAGVIVAPESSYANTIIDTATEISADLALIPWSESGSMGERQLLGPDSADSKFANSSYTGFVSTVLSHAACNTAVFIDRGFGSPKRRNPRTLHRTLSGVSMRGIHDASAMPAIDQGHHIYLPYFGSEDDKLALHFVLQLCQNLSVTATVVHFEIPESGEHEIAKSQLTKHHSINTSTDPKSPVTTTVHPIESGHYADFFRSVRDSLTSALSSRVVFEISPSSAPLDDVLARAKTEVGLNPKNAGDLIVVGRNMALETRLARGGMQGRTDTMGSEAKRCLGSIVERLVGEGLRASLAVLQVGERRG